LPKENKRDLEDVPKEVLRDLKFVFVSHMDEVLGVALTKNLKKARLDEAKQPMKSEHPVLHAPSPQQAD
jgi:ATP-dependent Lon protease